MQLNLTQRKALVAVHIWVVAIAILRTVQTYVQYMLFKIMNLILWQVMKTDI